MFFRCQANPAPCRGRDGDCSPPPAQIRTCALTHTALTSGVWRQLSGSARACRMRAIACDTLSRCCARRVFCWSAFPLVPVLGSTDSAADCSALFAGFTATIPGSDFPPPCVIGYGSSPFRCGPGQNIASGQTRDLPASGAFLSRVTCSQTPAGRTMPRMTALPMLRSAISTDSAPATCLFRGSITHPTRLLWTLRGRRCRRLTHHLLPGALLGLTRAGPSPAGLHQLWLAPSSR